MNERVSLTEQLRRYAAGDKDIADAVFHAVYPRLREIASRSLKPHERRIALLSTGDLIHEVWVSHLRKGGFEIKSMEHFYSIASRAMRQVLVDLARRRLAQRRGEGDHPISIEAASGEPAPGANAESVVAMGLLMDQLEVEDIEAARVIDMDYWVGFTHQEIATYTGLSVRQVRHRSKRGHDWLKDRLTGTPPDPAQAAPQKKRRFAVFAPDRTPKRDK